MHIYLARPGGPRLGPYSLDKINADLAARKYKDDDFWAWHAGLTSWVPLYSIGGVGGAPDTSFFFVKPLRKGEGIPTKPPETPAADTTIFLAKRPDAESVLGQPLDLRQVRPAGSAPAPVPLPVYRQTTDPTNSEAGESGSSAEAMAPPEPAQPVDAAPEGQSSTTLSATEIVSAVQADVAVKENTPLVQTFPGERRSSAETQHPEHQTPFRLSASRFAASVRKTLAPKPERGSAKKAAPGRKASSSPIKSRNDKPKAQVQPQTPKSAMAVSVPNRRTVAKGRRPTVTVS